MKTDLQRSKKSSGRILTKIWSEKYSCWSLSELLTEAGRPGRSTETESKPLCRSTDPVDEGKTESNELLPVDRAGRSMCTHALWCMSVDRPVDRQSNSALPAVDRAVDRTRPKTVFPKGFLKIGIFDKNSLDRNVQNRVLGLVMIRV